MEKIGYILQLNNINAPEGTSGILKQTASREVLRKRKRRRALKLTVILLSVAAVAAAVTAAVFAVSRALKQPDTRDRVTIYYISQESHFHELFLFTAALTRITGQGEVIMSQRYYSD